MWASRFIKRVSTKKYSDQRLEYILRIVEKIHATDQDTWQQDGVTVRRVQGGMNNALYHVDLDGCSYTCKLCVPDERQRACREDGALRLLWQVGLDVAPQPLGMDQSCKILPYPAVVYHWLEGESFGTTLENVQVSALLDSMQRFHALRAGSAEVTRLGIDLLPAWFHWFDRTPYLEDLRGFQASYSPWLEQALPEGKELSARLRHLVRRCEQAFSTRKRPRVDLRYSSFPVCLCHVDVSLTNVIYDPVQQRVRWIDWEYAGWGDPAHDLSDMCWHAGSAALSGAQQAWLRANYRPSPDDYGFAGRLALWDHLIVVRWPFLVLRRLWSEQHGPDRLRLAQVAAASQGELYQQLVRLIVRAERFCGV